MEEALKFEELYDAYLLCLKNKKRKAGTFNFVNSNLCENLISLLDSLNNCRYKCNEKLRNKVPEKRKMNPKSKYGMAIGNLTAQAASNLNLVDFINDKIGM